MRRQFFCLDGLFKSFKRNTSKLTALVLTMSLICPLTSYATEVKWDLYNSKWVCYVNSRRVYNNSVSYKGATYFIKQDGYMASNEIIGDDYYSIDGKLVPMNEVDKECNRIIGKLLSGEVSWVYDNTDGTTVLSQLNHNRLFTNMRLHAQQNESLQERMIIDSTEVISEVLRQYLVTDEMITKIVEPVIYSSDTDKIKYISEWIKNKFTYSYDNMYSVYDALNSNESVCSGYSSMFKAMCNKVGIQCDVVTGTANNTQGIYPHAWNKVILSGVDYYFDICWNDMSNGVDKYWFMTLEQISTDHFAK